MIYYKEEVTSTNDWAKECSEMESGTVFTALRQTKGKGRRGRNWVSDENGLWMSILLKPDFSDVSIITLAAGLSVKKTLGDTAFIKWPNDIVMSSKKVCGILTEAVADNGRVNYAVCGIGVNLNNKSFDGDISDIATSVYIETGKVADREEILKGITDNFNDYYNLIAMHGFEAIRDEYKKACITLGKDVKIVSATGEYVAYASDIDSSGELIVLKDGEEICVRSGEVSVRGLFGYGK